MGKESDKITLSPKYGVNPTILHCFICGKETVLALLGKLKGDVEAPKDMTNPNELCDDCKRELANIITLYLENFEEGRK